uniref:Uncharacterized protein n=1 Tax=Spumella elongata TaxID=89044 RepID=A0A7S3M7Z3_9STRA|mmetsp:Transcript_40257/g.69696  ORF Transcript_40257/g.69696 Transcript_40257/m.69696 type:complete len:114 (+) Transcript_40257:71-412(+)
MGAASSIQPEIFTLAKDEYEAKKGEGLTDEQLFDHMKTFISDKTAEMDKKLPEEAVAPVEAAVEAAVETTAETTVEATAENTSAVETADAPPSMDLENIVPTAGDEKGGTRGG